MAKKILTLITALSLICFINLTSALLINSVSMDPERIAPGEKSIITLSLKNNGDNDLSDVSISLDLANLPLAPYVSGSEVSINELNSDKTKNAEFQVIAFNDAKSGIYKIPVKIEYKEDDIVKIKQSVISIMVNSEPIIEVSYDNGLLLKGQKNQIELKIVNKGLGDVKFLELELGTSTAYNILSQNKIYVGDIDSNDFQTEEFEIFFNPNPLKNVNLPINVKYKDVANKEYKKNYDLQLKVYTKKQAQNLDLIPRDNTIYIVIVVIVLIIVFLIYRMIRKRRKQEENL